MKTESILVVGEEPALRETLVRLIAMEGHEVSGASTAEEATARLETEMHTVVFVDLAITGGKGDEFAPRVREKWPGLGIVLLAEQAEAERERRAKVIHAEGEYQASQRLSEAAEIIERHPTALQLRYLQALTEVAAENNSTMVFPLPIDLLTPFLKSKEAVGR